MLKSKYLVGLFLLLLTSCLDDDLISPEAQLKKDIATIDSYLTQNGINAVKDASGIRIAIQSLGVTGLPPDTESTVEVNYKGKLLSNGTIFDQGNISGKTSKFIVGWGIAMPMLPEGTKATLYIPSAYAYGSQPQRDKYGNVTIPANSILIFEIELVAVTPSDRQVTQLQTDITLIDQYIADNSITATSLENGIRYSVVTEGMGAAPSLFSQVKFSIKGSLTTGTNAFFNETVAPTADFSSRVANFFNALKIALPLMKEGGKSIFYVPSVLAYGANPIKDSSGNIVVPANSVVIFEIELIDVIE
jgi:FKBP-type peptidyl-prolyl cis-trans isomerase